MITATLQNVTKEGQTVSFYVIYSEGTERNYRFPAENFQTNDLVTMVKNEIRSLEAIDTAFNTIVTLKGKTYKLVGDTLTEVK